MSFGWSAGDIVSAVNFLVKIGRALRECGGAASEYQETSSFLEGLSATLGRLATYIDNHAASRVSLHSIEPQVDVVQAAVTSFKDKIDGKFGAELGANSGGGWKRIFNGPRKIEYAIFVTKKARSLQTKIAIPLGSIQISLGIESLSAVSDLSIETRETRSVVEALINNGTTTVTTVVSGLAVEARETGSAVADMQSTVSKIQSTLTASDDMKLRRKVGEWLRPVSSEDDFEAIRPKLHPGTCKWIFDKPDFSRWMENKTDAPPLFWISGIPGGGKSYLATRIIEILQGIYPTYPLAYFYCDSNDEQKRSVLNILRTWVWQLLQQIPGCLAEIALIFNKGELPSISNMRKALKVLSENRRVVYILDGLDECDPNARCEFFGLILPDILSHSRVLIVSRNLPDISLGISKCVKNVKDFASLQISEADNRNDIIKYIQNAVCEMDPRDEALKETIRTTLQKNAKGMFLWARLMIEDLAGAARSIEESERALLDLPQGLDEYYGRVLHNLYSDTRTRDRSQRLFQWLACALRPLKIGELKVALAIELDAEHFQPKKVIPKFEDCLRQCCGPLVNIERDGGTVSLIHSSVKDFLLSTPAGKRTYSSLLVESAIAHAHIARACLTYLCFKEIGLVDVTEGPEVPQERLSEHFRAWEFLNYAASNWYMHFGIVESSIGCTALPKVIQSFRRLYCSEYNTAKWLQLIQSLPRGNLYIPSEESRCVSEAMYYLRRFGAGTLGLEHEPLYQEWLVHLDGRPTRRCSRWRRFMEAWRLPVLYISAAFDFDTLAKQLINEGGSARLRGHRGNTLLHAAARADAVEITKLLLAAKDVGFVNGRDHDGKTALHVAALANAVDVTKLLLVEVTEMLLAVEDISFVNLRDHDGFTALHEAVLANSMDVTKLLLQYGADVDAGPATPLMKACGRKGCLVVPVLIQGGANVDARDHDGRTSLHMAARVNNYDAARMLLEHGADVNAMAGDDSLPLHDAVRENHIELVELLMKHKTKLETKDASGRTPFQIAMDTNFTEAVTLLRNACTNASRKGPVVDRNDEQSKGAIDPQMRPPASSHDLFYVYWILTRQLDTPLPRFVVTKLITLAKYWLKSDDRRSDLLIVAQADVGPVYLKSSPIQGNVQQIVFTFESNDQGWSDWDEDQGSFDNSWTWFEVEIFDAQGVRVAVEEHERKLYVNVHASSKRRKNVVVCGRGLHMRQSRWLENLRPGYCVGIVPYARYPGWLNYVHAARIEIYSTCLVPVHEN